MTKPASMAPSVLRSAILEEHKHLATIYPDGDSSYTKIYPNFEAAVAARIRTVTKYPGNQTLSREAAVAIVSRGTCYADTGEPVWSGPDGTDRESEANKSRPVKFVHAAAMMLPSYYYSTEEQVL